MPELPEVETIKVGLSQKIVGLKIKKVEVLSSKSFLGDLKDIEGRKVIDIIRRAKMLSIALDNDLKLLIHLKMSGQLILDGVPTKSTRVIFHFEDGSKLLFNDQRKFGWIKVISDDSHFDKLGPEPLEKDFTYEVFKTQILKRKNTPIKVALLDQEIISGIGNIYACEAVFISRIDPRRKVSDLKDTDLKSLYKAVVEVLQKGVNLGGSSSVHYVNIEGVRGTFLEEAFVYKREYKPCKVCGTTLEKLKLGGRGTTFCPNCQK
jgi:formamidopyrimidine-DNA glycosylase